MSTCNNTDAVVQPDVFEWRPADLIRARPRSPHADDRRPPGFALVVLNQPLHTDLSVIHKLWVNAHTRIAADGGANRLYDAAGKHGDASLDDLHLIIGDLDSLTPTTQSYYASKKTAIIRDPDQESTDFGKAVAYIRQHHYALPSPPSQHASASASASASAAGPVDSKQPPDIVAVGGLGGRVDQGLSQLHHLYLFQSDPRYAEGRMYLFSGESLTFLLQPGRHRIRVRDDDDHDVEGAEKKGEEGEEKGREKGDLFGKHVGILPVGGESRITTRGLEWDVSDWETRFGGRVSTSNHVLPETKVVEVETTREVLFTIALREEGKW